jgi:RNA polymerase sigma-70 factor (ECF subfamily)
VTTDDRDPQQFRVLFDANFSDIWRFARRRCASATDADDVTAQVFAVAWRRRDDLPENEQARLWLFGVARRTLSNHHRTLVRSERMTERVADMTSRRGAPQGPAAESPVHWLVDAVKDLPAPQAEVVIMRYWDELTVSEIAELLDCTPNTVSIRLHQARNRLRSHLTQKDPAAGGHVSDEPTRQTEEP